jgi:hypothetical protein
MTSPDGLTWTSHILDRKPFHQVTFHELAYGNGFFLAAGERIFPSSPRGMILSSADGVKWIERDLGRFSIYPDVAVTSGQDSFLLLAEEMSLSGTHLLQSGQVSEAPFSISIRADASSIVEGQEPGTFWISRSGNNGMDLDLPIRFEVGGTAINGVDFQTVPNLAVIPAGVFAIPILIEPLPDQLQEGPESVQITIQPGELYAIDGDPAALLMIEDPSVAPKFRIRGTTRLADGTVHLTIDTFPGSAVTVERSADLKVWKGVATINSSPGLIQLDDPPGNLTSQQFYRARVPEGN